LTDCASFERSAWDHKRGEDLPEGGIVLSPADLDQLEQGLTSLDLSRVSSRAPALRVASGEHEPRHAFGMAHGIDDRDRGALGVAEKRETVETKRVDHRLEIAHEGLERDVRNVPIGKAGSALVVADQAELLGQAAQQGRPHRTLPIELDVVHPVRGLDHRQAVSAHRDREIDAFRRAAKAHLLSRRMIRLCGWRRRRLLADLADEPEAAAGDRAYEALLFAAVADRMPRP
jgi:hypothetical protein